MDGCGCDFAEIFDERSAEQDRSRYRRNGPDRTTRQLLDLVKRRGVAGASVLDVGGGIGVVDLELLRAGAGHATLVDASVPSLRVARAEAAQSGVLDRLEITEGDFVRLAPVIDRADIVTLDRVVCCYGDAVGLVSQAADHTRRVLALVLPRDRWLFRVAARVLNAAYRLRGRAYRAYAHSNDLVDRLAAEAGLHPTEETGTFVWRVVVYERTATA
jgi:magnesium-protoporphyrin O-methyltransferase